MPRLSLAMIVKNEAKHLAHCLESVRGLADELVILDTGSTDGTQDIARGFGARVEDFAWVDDFSAARNACLARCTGEWILVLDADEAIDALDHAVLRQALEDPEAEAYFLWLREYFRSGAFVGLSGPVARNEARYSEGAAYSHQQSFQSVRLFRAQPGPVFRGRIHELAEQHFQERGVRIRTLDAVIHHFGKVDAELDRRKQAEYTRLAKLEAAARPRDPMAHYNVVQQALLVEDWEAVLASADAYLSMSERVPMMIYLGSAQALMNLDRPAEALPRLEAMLAQRPDHAAALDAKGEVLSRLGRHSEAQACFLEAVEADPGFTLPFLHLARLLEAEGDISRSRAVLEAGLDQNPKDLVLWTQLVALSARSEPERAPADAWDAIQALPDQGQGIWHQIVIHALLAREAREDARIVLERGLQAFPGDPGLLALGDRLR